jgi:uncharacterized membrane protein YadS
MTITGIVRADSQLVTTFIAVMSVLTIPLIPTMPMMGKLVNDEVVGAWIGGCVDSTGAVIATASLGGDAVLRAAIVIKMLQNLLIGPVALVITGIHTGSFKPAIIWDKFPKFVLGFVVVAVITTFTPRDEMISKNSFIISEWFSALSFVMIGFDINLREASGYLTNGKKILLLYVVGQMVDIGLTFIAAYLMFQLA